MSELDTNIDNWSTTEILDLLGLTNPSSSEIEIVANRMISKASDEGKTTLVTFLKQARSKALQKTGNEEEESSFNEQASDQLLDWWHNQSLPQSNQTQADRVTSRQNKVQTFDDDNGHYQMKRETLGVNQVFNLPVAQGTINPNLKNVVERTVIIDSQYRANVFPYAGTNISEPSFPTSFSVDLTETLQNVISMELYSVQFPKTWNNISGFIGNNCFGLENTGQTEINWQSVTDGYYENASVFVDYINSNQTYPYGIDMSYNSITNRIGVKVIPSLAVNTIVWYDGVNPPTDPNCSSCVTNSFSNNNLGWTLGFRSDYDDDTGSLTSTINGTDYTWAQAAPNFNGPQYLLLSLDDYNHNRLNKGIIGTNITANKVDMPNYTSCNNLTQDTSGNTVAVMTAPRQLTRAQLFTINKIYESRQAKKSRNVAPTTNNVLGVIPVGNDPHGSTITMLGPDMASNGRDYFGPVTIERVGVELQDDKGNLLDLNGIDWSFTFKVKQLYQY
jgi:hypothetical protein